MHIIRHRMTRLGRKDVKGKPRDKAKPRIKNVNVPSIGQMNPQRNERVAFKLLGQSFRVHAHILQRIVHLGNLNR